MQAPQAQIMMDASTVSDFLMITNEQQMIYVERFLKANKDVYKECMSGVTIEKATTDFSQWLEQRPQYLRRNLTSALTAALLARCK